VRTELSKLITRAKELGVAGEQADEELVYEQIRRYLDTNPPERLRQLAGLLRFRNVNPFDHNAECLLCDEQGEHDENCPWHLVENIKGYDPHG
jgi:hypothetical protein